jgi:hypothetical protein
MFMVVFTDFCLCIVLGSIAWTDFRYRSISLFQLVALLICAILHGHLFHTLLEQLIFSSVNCIFLSAQGLLVYAWFKLRQGKDLVFTDGVIGKGDLLFFPAIAPILDTIQFIWCYTAGLFIVLVTVLFYWGTTQKKPASIPLAGAFSLYLIGLTLWEKIISTHIL